METILVLIYSTGSLPPPYAYSYTINFYKDGSAAVKFFKGYEDSPTYTETRAYDGLDLKKEIEGLKKIKDDTTASPMVGGERREIIYIDEEGTGRLSISPENKEAIDAFERLLLVFDPNFETLINTRLQHMNL